MTQRDYSSQGLVCARVCRSWAFQEPRNLGGGELESGTEAWQGEAMEWPVFPEKESLEKRWEIKLDIQWKVKQCPTDGTWPWSAGKERTNSPNSLFPCLSPVKSPREINSQMGRGGESGTEGRKGSWKVESHNGLYFCCNSSSFKELPHTWRELDFLLRICLSSRLKTIFMSCGCLHANLSFRWCVPLQTPTEAYQQLPSVVG